MSYLRWWVKNYIHIYILIIDYRHSSSLVYHAVGREIFISNFLRTSITHIQDHIGEQDTIYPFSHKTLVPSRHISYPIF